MKLALLLLSRNLLLNTQGFSVTRTAIQTRNCFLEPARRGKIGLQLWGGLKGRLILFWEPCVFCLFGLVYFLLL